MKILTFYEKINLFLENKRPRKTLAFIHRSDACVRRHRPAHGSTNLHTQLWFEKPMKDKFFALKSEVWNESHIVWEPFQTPIFQLYKALHGIFQKHRKS